MSVTHRHVPFLGPPALDGGPGGFGELLKDLGSFQVTILRDWRLGEGAHAVSEKVERLMECL